MIIGNNNDNLNKNNNFNNKINGPDIDNPNKSHNPFVDNINSMQHSDPISREEMRDKSIAMLQDRLENGLITLEEFNQKVKNINKSK